MESISSFAESLILNEVSDISQGKSLPPAAQAQKGLAPAGKDISNVEVPDSFMSEVLGEGFHPQEEPTADAIPELVWAEEEPQEAPKTSLISEEMAQNLVPLLEEVRDLLKEMTTAGGLGVNMAGPQKDNESWAAMEKSYGYKAPKKPTLPGDSRKAVLKQAIKNKLRKRNK
jgi:hypothetical protein